MTPRRRDDGETTPDAPDAPSGDVAAESGDVAGDAGRIGDTPLEPGSKPHYVDTSGDVRPDPQGDEVVPGYVSALDRPDDLSPTAGRLREAGYVVSDKIPDDVVPPSYAADTPTPPGEIRPVVDTTTSDGVDRSQTPAEFARSQPTPDEDSGEAGGGEG